MATAPLAPFLLGHATHPDWRMALALVAAQIDAGLAARRGEWTGQAEPQAGKAAPAGSPDMAAPLPGTHPTLGLVYFTDHYVDEAEELYAELQQRWPGVSFVGSVGVGIAAGGVEYFDQPALAVLMGELPRSLFRVFSGTRALPAAPEVLALDDPRPFTALVHGDGRTTDLPEVITELAGRTQSGYLFGGLASARGEAVTLADGVFRGGVSGVGFSADLALLSRVTQGAAPVGPARRITRCDRNLVLELDGEAALDCLVRDLAIDLDQPRAAMARLRTTLAGLADAGEDLLARRGQFGTDTRVRHLIGLDPARRGVALAELVSEGQQLAFCRRDTEAARRDLIRICSELREELEPAADAGPAGVTGAWSSGELAATLQRMAGAGSARDDTHALLARLRSPGTGPAVTPSTGQGALPAAAAGAGQATSAPAAQPPSAGLPPPRRAEDEVAAAIYVSCAGRGGPHFGAPSAELQLVRHALGEVPLIGFFAGGEIARHHLYGYTGVLTVLRRQAPLAD
ncbi:MAG: hypothetical protein RL722_2243 [Pseudomonadota bacterium]|jgi:small ligand-binding sensory domain FIST